MIPASELRLGNLVLAPLLWEGQFFNVIELYSDECSVSPDDKIQSRIISYQDLVPIPLSAALLNSFGFETQVYDSNNTTCYHLFTQNTHHFYLSHDLQPIQSPDLPIPVANQTLHSFHQLQNLFFAVTGQELSIFASLR
jgi:hypothetical protein